MVLLKNGQRDSKKGGKSITKDIDNPRKRPAPELDNYTNITEPFQTANAKASLPSSLGGLNIRRASQHAPAAYINSLVQSEEMASKILGHALEAPRAMGNSISMLAEAAARPDWVSLEEIDVPLRQRPLSHSIDEACFRHLLTSAPDIRSKGLAHSTALPHAGAWLNVVPSTSLGLHLQDKEFRLCLQYWLGLRMGEEGALLSHLSRGIRCLRGPPSWLWRERRQNPQA